MTQDPSADALLRVVSGIEQRFLETQAGLREEVFVSRSADGLVELVTNGEGLAVRVSVDPALVARGNKAVEQGVMQAVNDAAITLQEHTTAAFQLAAADAFGLGPVEGQDDLPPGMRAQRNA